MRFLKTNSKNDSVNRRRKPCDDFHSVLQLASCWWFEGSKPCFPSCLRRLSGRADAVG